MQKLRHLLFIPLLALFASPLLQAQTDSLSPFEIVSRYVSPDGFPGKRDYVSGDLAGERRSDTTLGQRLPLRVQRTCRLVRQDSMMACVAVWLRDSATSRDIYIFLRKAKRWQMYTIRSLAGTEIIRNDLKRLDSIPLNQRGKTYTQKTGHTFAFDVANSNLFLANDDSLMRYFNKHRTAFSQLYTTLERGRYLNRGDSVLAHSGEKKNVRKQLDRLLLRSVAADKNYPGMVLFVIGGVGDNRVGYLYQPDPAKLPPALARYYMLVQPLGNGWYLFKTT